MFGKSLDLSMKRDVTGALTFYVAHLVILVGVSSVLAYFLGMAGVVEGVGSFFEGGHFHTMVGSLFVLWLGGTILAKRGLTSDIMSIIIVMIGLYFAWTSSVLIGMVPIALLTTISK